MFLIKLSSLRSISANLSNVSGFASGLKPHRLQTSVTCSVPQNSNQYQRQWRLYRFKQMLFFHLLSKLMKHLLLFANANIRGDPLFEPLSLLVFRFDLLLQFFNVGVQSLGLFLYQSPQYQCTKRSGLQNPIQCFEKNTHTHTRTCMMLFVSSYFFFNSSRASSVSCEF